MDSLDWILTFFGVCMIALVTVGILGGRRGWPVRRVGVATTAVAIVALVGLAWSLGLDLQWVLGSLVLMVGAIAAWGWGIARVERAARLSRESRDKSPTDQR